MTVTDRGQAEAACGWARHWAGQKPRDQWLYEVLHTYRLDSKFSNKH